MPFHMQKEDTRSSKTKKLLCAAMLALLKHHGYKKITVGDLCEEALISRATFYAHFSDKYDLLDYWLEDLRSASHIGRDEAYEDLEKAVNRFFVENKAIIKNLFEDADQETLEVLFDFILSYLYSPADQCGKERADAKYIVLSNFFAGGVTNYLSWHIKNKFQTEVMNRFLYDLIRNLQEWGLQE